MSLPKLGGIVQPSLNIIQPLTTTSLLRLVLPRSLFPPSLPLLITSYPTLVMLAFHSFTLLVLALTAFAAPIVSSPPPDVRTIQTRANAAAVSVLSDSEKSDVATFAELSR